MRKKVVITIVISSIIVLATVTYAICIAIISRFSFKLSSTEYVTDGVVLMQAFDDKYSIGHVTSQHNKKWAKKNDYTYKRYSTVTEGEKSHFMRYRASLDLFEDPTVKYVVYVDGDAALNFKHSKLIKAQNKDLTFGNEFVYHNHWGWLTKKSPINSGYIAAKNTPYVINLFKQILNSKLCQKCRQNGCGLHNFKDQGCLDKMLKENKFVDTKKTGIVQSQSRQWPTNSLLIHPAGSSKKTYPNLKKYISDHLLGRV